MEDETIREATPEECREMFDYTARHYLGISGEEFLRRRAAGALADLNQHGLGIVYLMLPLVEPHVST